MNMNIKKLFVTALVAVAMLGGVAFGMENEINNVVDPEYVRSMSDLREEGDDREGQLQEENEEEASFMEENPEEPEEEVIDNGGNFSGRETWPDIERISVFNYGIFSPLSCQNRGSTRREDHGEQSEPETR